MPLLDHPALQAFARGAAIDFLFYAQAADGTRTPQPLTGAIEAECFALFRKPGDGPPVYVRKPLTLVDLPGGRARYVTEDGFLDAAGTWFAQGFIVYAGGPPSSFIPSEVVRLLVRANIRTLAPSLVPLQPSPALVSVTAPNVTVAP